MQVDDEASHVGGDKDSDKRKRDVLAPEFNVDLNFEEDEQDLKETRNRIQANRAVEHNVDGALQWTSR